MKQTKKGRNHVKPVQVVHRAPVINLGIAITACLRSISLPGVWHDLAGGAVKLPAMSCIARLAFPARHCRPRSIRCHPICPARSRCGRKHRLSLEQKQRRCILLPSASQNAPPATAAFCLRPSPGSGFAHRLNSRKLIENAEFLYLEFHRGRLRGGAPVQLRPPARL